MQDNKPMLNNLAKQIQHHAKELTSVINSTDEIEAWVLAKAERSATDLSDITHYLEGVHNVVGKKILYKFNEGQNMSRKAIILKDNGDSYLVRIIDNGDMHNRETNVKKDDVIQIFERHEYVNGGMMAKGGLIATSPSLEGIKKIIGNYYYSPNILLKRVEGSNEYEIHNAKGKISSVKVVEKKGRFQFLESDNFGNGGYVKVVLDEGYGRVINQLYNEWNNVKNQKEYDKWISKVQNTKFGTYGTVPIWGILENFDFDNAPINNFHLKSFKNELKSALNKMQDGGMMAKGGKVDMLKEGDYVWNAVGKKLVVDDVTDTEYSLSGFMQKGTSKWSKTKVHSYIKNGEWSLKPKMSDGGMMAKGGEIKRFDRHKEMDAETRENILSLLKELSYEDYNTSRLENYLYGLFDGYDYSKTDDFKKEMNKLNLSNKALYNEINATYQKINQYSSDGHMAKGGVTFLGEYKDDERPQYFRRFKNAIGSFAWEYNKNYNEGILYPLSDFDKSYYSHLKLKSGEHLFRYKTDRMIKGSAYLIKINLDKSLIYFMTDSENNDDKNPIFDTRGIKAEYITIQRDTYSDGGYMAKGGGIGFTLNSISEKEFGVDYNELSGSERQFVKDKVNKIQEINKISQKEFASNYNQLSESKKQKVLDILDYNDDDDTVVDYMAKGGEIKKDDYFVYPNGRGVKRFRILKINGDKVTTEYSTNRSIVQNIESKEDLIESLKEGYIKKVTEKEYWDKKYEMEKGGVMENGGELRKIKGNNFSDKIENGQKFKVIIQKVFYTQNGDTKYPIEFIRATALTPLPIVKNEGKNYIKGYSYKGTITNFEFLDDANFVKALEFVDRPPIKSFKFEEGGMMAKGGMTFADKVDSVKARLLKGKKVSPSVQKDYGKTYNPKEAEDSAKRIVGSQVAKYKMK